MPAIILFAVWKNFGYNMIILLAGLQGIPEELYEAARIDGASAWRQFRHVTLPMLAPIIAMVSILTIAGYFQLFAEPYVMTQGGPLQSTVSVLYFMYEEGFKWWNLGSASAVAFVLFLFIFARDGAAAAARAMARRRVTPGAGAACSSTALLLGPAAVTLVAAPVDGVGVADVARRGEHVSAAAAAAPSRRSRTTASCSRTPAWAATSSTASCSRPR